MQFPTSDELRAGVDAYNRFLAGIWAARQDEIAHRARAAVAGLDAKSVSDVQVLELDLAAPPQLGVETEPGPPVRETFTLRAPGVGHWSLRLRARVKIAGKRTLKIRLSKLSVRLGVEVERPSPWTAVLVPGAKVKAKFHLDVDSSNLVLDAVIDVFERLLRPLIDREARRALGDALPDFARVSKIAALGLGAVAPAVVPGEVPRERLAARAAELARRVRAQHMPWGAVLSARLGATDPGSAVASYAHYQDAAIWTGHYVAAESLRSAITGETEALEHVRWGLDGLRRLTRLTVDHGLLSRVAVPLASPFLESVDLDMIMRGKQDRLFNGEEDAVVYRAIGHISRDQYTGAFLGAGFAALHAGDTEIRELARGLALEMAGYLLERQFCPAEARLDPAAPELTATTWALNPNQALAILSLARRLDPERFGAPCAELAAAAPVLWFFPWLSSLDPHDSYFKFNLEHSLALLGLPLVDDLDARRALALPFRLVREVLRHHGNAYFDLVELAALGELDALTRPREQIEGEIRDGLARWLERPEVLQESALADDPSLDVVDFPGPDGEVEKIARLAVEVERRPTTDFLWQRSPFSLRPVFEIPNDVAIRPPGIDLLLPYWLARRLGVL